MACQAHHAVLDRYADGGSVNMGLKFKLIQNGSAQH
jgi:hypothetical protein